MGHSYFTDWVALWTGSLTAKSVVIAVFLSRYFTPEMWVEEKA